MLNKTALTLACLLFALSSDAVMLDQCCGCHLSPCDSHCDDKKEKEEEKKEEEKEKEEDEEEEEEEDENPPPDGCCWFYKNKEFYVEDDALDKVEVCIS